ncbi:Uncharacterized protein APZ42_015238 [Daphnia magna]|uniref:Uncharacterized protein n=1 Tax=Daphnia magna TaxID=35525 RepID=A0A162PB32_9CRUS|nr:Uncharacterized protein APZ42_015238 [Daphnia magna]
MRPHRTTNRTVKNQATLSVFVFFDGYSMVSATVNTLLEAARTHEFSQPNVKSTKVHLAYRCRALAQFELNRSPN